MTHGGLADDGALSLSSTTAFAPSLASSARLLANVNGVGIPLIPLPGVRPRATLRPAARALDAGRVVAGRGRAWHARGTSGECALRTTLKLARADRRRHDPGYPWAGALRRGN